MINNPRGRRSEKWERKLGRSQGQLGAVGQNFVKARGQHMGTHGLGSHGPQKPVE